MARGELVKLSGELGCDGGERITSVTACSRDSGRTRKGNRRGLRIYSKNYKQKDEYNNAWS